MINFFSSLLFYFFFNSYAWQELKDGLTEAFNTKKNQLCCLNNFCYDFSLFFMNFKNKFEECVSHWFLTVVFFLTGRLLIYEGYLQENPVRHGFGMTISLSQKAYGWLQKSRQDSNVKFELVPSQEMLAQEKSRVIPVIAR